MLACREPVWADGERTQNRTVHGSLPRPRRRAGRGHGDRARNDAEDDRDSADDDEHDKPARAHAATLRSRTAATAERASFVTASRVVVHTSARARRTLGTAHLGTHDATPGPRAAPQAYSSVTISSNGRRSARATHSSALSDCGSRRGLAG